ncbi:hypothetical protein LRH25_13010 [Ideonella azotifigens]|uniref:Lycopene cyclase domain-containing protein n=1 Tax=Ideonella azotifigens TaxID=513160 RepID=A0ABP3V965_9BURK|nr:hypothetical protein [Ideonella azotifigens]MCD2341262.1 hypothetical protein [Ideonella azotifigens]
MHASVFVELRFWLLVLFSLMAATGIYLAMMRRSVSRLAVLGFGLALVLIAGIDVYLLQSLSNLARHTPSLTDDTVFLSELSIGLYLLPALFAGIGINVVSHVLIQHLSAAERRFDRTHGVRDPDT